MRKKCIFTLVLSISILLSFTVKIRLDSEAAESINTVYIADAPTDITVEPVIIPSLIVGADYISELFEQYENIYLVLMMYNMEHDTARELYDSGVYSDYAVNIVERMRELEQLHKMNQN